MEDSWMDKNTQKTLKWRVWDIFSGLTWTGNVQGWGRWKSNWNRNAGNASERSARNIQVTIGSWSS